MSNNLDDNLIKKNAYMGENKMVSNLIVLLTLSRKMPVEENKKKNVANLIVLVTLSWKEPNEENKRNGGKTAFYW